MGPWMRVPSRLGQLHGDHVASEDEAWLWLLSRWNVGADPGVREVRARTKWGASRAVALLDNAAAWAEEHGAAYVRRPKPIEKCLGTQTKTGTQDQPETDTIGESQNKAHKNEAGTQTKTGRLTRALPLLRSEEIRSEEIPEGQTIATQPQPEPAPMSRPDDLDAAADGYRSGRTGPNLSDPPPPERSGVIAPDGREVPATWAELLRPLALAAMPRDASRLGELCRRLRAIDADPVDLLRIPVDEWRYVRGLGPVDAGRLADLATRAGWPPGLLVVAPIRKMTESEALDAITGEESQRWQDAGCKRDPITGACIVPPLLTLLEGGP